jgi:hypothetical protein
MNKITVSRTYSGIPVDVILEIKEISDRELNGNESATVVKLLREALNARKIQEAGERKGEGK